MKLKDLLAPFSIWKRAFEKPYTIKNPIDERPGSDRYRGFHQNKIDKCIGCGTCETICQNRAIDMVPVLNEALKPGDSGLRPKIDYGRCCWCGLCVDVCLTSSLSMSNEYIWVDNDPEVFRYIPGVDEKSWDETSKGYKRPKGYGLLNPSRQKMGTAPAALSLTSFVEVVKGYSRKMAMNEADRCVECGLCRTACPAQMDIPGYIRAVREDNLKEGLRLLYETNPFPAACGRVCTHNCEEVCAIGHMGDPLAIRWLKRYIADQFPIEKYKEILPEGSESKKEKVVVIGSGPGGLSFAYYLALAGYKVEVFERKPKAGGMLRYGIPEYRLPYDQLDKDIESITSLGITITCGKKVDSKQFLSLLKSKDAVFLSPGLSEPYNLGIEGEENSRVFPGLQVLADITDGKKPDLGKKVAVIGGGNAAMDAARTARRLGCDVTVLYRRREEDMPADQEEIEDALLEKVELITHAIPVKIVGKGKSKVVFVWGKAEMVDQGEGKRPKPVLIEDQIEEREFDSIISAVGQGADLALLSDESGIETQRYKIVRDKSGQTSNPKVFIGGDISNSMKDAISAIADGHNAAVAVDRYLSGKK